VEARLERIKKRLFEEYYRKKSWWGDELSIFDDDPGLASRPLVVRKALAVRKVCREMPIEVKEDELVVGVCTMSSVGFGHTFPRYETEAEAEAAARVCLNRKSVWGHHNPHYPKVLAQGIAAIIQEARRLASGLPAAEQDRRDWYEAVVLSLEGAGILAGRYAELCERLAAQARSSERAAELGELARICRKVPMQPAGSFQEALQSVWLVHVILQSTLDYTSIGRVDQYLWPFYREDLARGAITRSRARELLGSFLVKFNERVQLDNAHIENHFTFGDWSQGGDPELETTHLKMSNEQAYTYGQSQNHWLQNCVVGGLTPEGGDGTNELSGLVIELVNELELIDPLVSLRLHAGSPPAIVAQAARWLARGGAQPTIFNDEVFVPGMVRHLGIPLEDARDYSNDGCWETLPCGRTEFSYGHIEVLLSLESTLNRGRSLLSGKPIGPDSGEPAGFATFGELQAAFQRQVAARLDAAVQNKLRYYDELYKIAPDPFLSGLVEDCLAKGLDLTRRGARYRLYAPLVTGFSHCVDSLAAIKQVVYERKLVSLERLVEILRNDWRGEERLRQYCLNRVPKYGNDDDYADRLGAQLLGFFCDCVEAWNRKVDWIRFAAGVGTFENYPRFGWVCGASADGRRAQAAVASNYSASFGMDRGGPTAALKSAAKFDLRRLNDGCPVDLKMNFGGDGSAALRDFIRGFLRLGGGILTVSRVSTATLLAAQREPEKHAGLRVRLGGLTAYFVQLCRAQQDEFIRRTEHGL
jgi:formate C-acetyltransferase